MEAVRLKHPRWTVDPLWRGETVAIIGGGPSLTLEQVEACRGRCRVIAVNTAYKLAPSADILYWCDDAWGHWHREDPDFRAFAGIKVALGNARTWEMDKSIRVLENYGERPELCLLRDGVHTFRNSGGQAMNLAYHLGVKRMLLLGFDMKPASDGRTHWHAGASYGHRRPTPPQDFSRSMMPCFPELSASLKAKGVEVLNCTPGSALTVFPFQPIEAAIAMLIAEKEAIRAARKARAEEPGYFRVAGGS